MKIRPYQKADETAVIELWKRAGLTRDWNDPKKDIERKLKVQRQWFVIGELENRIIASIMAGYDGHRGWINYLAVDPDHRQRGAGRQLMQHIEALLLDAGCPKINLQIRRTNQDAMNFYQQIGYSEDEVVSMGKRLIPDS